MKAFVFGMVSMFVGVFATVLFRTFYPITGILIITMSIVVGGCSVTLAGIPDIVYSDKNLGVEL